jgi:hypothetical protein
MVGAEAVIGLPDDGSVKKYMLNAKSLDAVVEMDGADQTLMDTSITQENGMTIMSFTKYLDEGQYGIEVGSNTFIFAVGNSNILDYHGERGSFTIDLVAQDGTSTSSSESASTSTLLTSTDATTTLLTATSTTGGDVELLDNETMTSTSSTGGDTTTGTTFDEGNVTMAPSPASTETDDSVGNVTWSTSPAEQAVTPSPSVVPNPMLSTAEPSLSSTDGDDSIADWNETEADDMIDSNSTQTTTASSTTFSSSTTVANETEVELDTPSPSAVGGNGTGDDVALYTPAPSSASNTTSNTTDEEYSGPEFASGESDAAISEESNGAFTPSRLVGSLFAGIATFFLVIV